MWLQAVVPHPAECPEFELAAQNHLTGLVPR
jgi:hypothetical protein